MSTPPLQSKKILFLLLSCLFFNEIRAQSPCECWYGNLHFPGTMLRLTVCFCEDKDATTGFLISPDQGNDSTALTSAYWDGIKMLFSYEKGDLKFEGQLIPADHTVSGIFTQRSQSFDFVLYDHPVEREKIIRPQDPEAPFPYTVENVLFQNKDEHFQLAGTFTIPKGKGPFPCAVLISGSGAQNRDEELLGHKPFLILADYLTRNGMAVLRYDDRGTSESGGIFKGSTSANFKDDAASAVEFLQSRAEIDQHSIGLIGHSEGGMIAPMLANGNKDIAFVISLAGPGVSGKEILLTQQIDISVSEGAAPSTAKTISDKNAKLFAVAISNIDSLEKVKSLNRLLEEIYIEEKNSQPDWSAFKQETISTLLDPWMVFFIKYDASSDWQKVICPVLALNGSKDMHVNSKINLNGIAESLEKGGNYNYKTIEMAGLNHLFQYTETGKISEYALLEETFSPSALNEIAFWLRKQKILTPQ